MWISGDAARHSHVLWIILPLESCAKCGKFSTLSSYPDVVLVASYLFLS